MKLLQVGRNLSGESFSRALLKIRKYLTNQNLEGLYVFLNVLSTHLPFSRAWLLAMVLNSISSLPSSF